jgi:pimeloyl-ACP methyl ester carboxylesterase
MAVPLRVGGALKDIIEAPDMEGYRQIDSKDILGPVYDAIPGGPPPKEVRDDYLGSYAGDRFVESARYVRTYPTELPKLAGQLPGIKTPVQIVSGRDDELVPPANAEFLHERLPNSRMELLPAGHFAWEEVPDLYGGILINWLSARYREASEQPPSTL